MLKRLVPDFGRFTGLRQLELQALRYVDCDIEDRWDEDAVLTTALLRHLPPLLERLTAAEFAEVQLWEEEEEEEEEGSSDEGSSSSSSEEGSKEPQHEGSSREDESSGSDGGGPGSGSGSRHSGSAGRAGRAAAAGSAAPARLPPGLTQLHICAVETVELGIALNSLVELSATCCNRVRLIGQQLHLPQLTSLSLALPPFVEAQFVAELRCAAMPALARLSTSFPIRPWGSFAALQQLTHLDLDPVDSFGLHHCLPLLQGLSPRLRSLSVGTQYQDIDANSAARVAAAAAGAPLTQLVGSCCQMLFILSAAWMDLNLCMQASCM